ncbi:unnamed protein product [Prorocentrum cordatum]|uniref:Small ribosomal subunit protein uS17 N-terminal domain-containing protein n=1 Tax=Prorocentrum cordatum TaxID=2364126 RepID=A0ABN9PZ88_9DINO|nr:unnamed protein product [Polarella glacialis]
MDQTEKAFQKQDAVFIGAKRLLGKKAGKKALRYWRNVGLGFSTPKEAKEGNFVDKKCPFTGNVSIRGKILKGMAISCKMKRTVIIRRNFLHYPEVQPLREASHQPGRALLPGLRCEGGRQY